jgi:hypothetical protein
MPRERTPVTDADLKFEWIAHRFRGEFATQKAVPRIRTCLENMARNRKAAEERMRANPDPKRRAAGDTE